MVSQHVSAPQGSCQLQMSVTPLTPSRSPQSLHPHGIEGLCLWTKDWGWGGGEQATKHSSDNGKSGRQVLLGHTWNCGLHEPTVPANNAGAPYLNGVFGVFMSLFKGFFPPIICFIAAMLPSQINHFKQEDWWFPKFGKKTKLIFGN